ATLAQKLGFAVAPDASGDPAGPLSGIKAALRWAKSRSADLVFIAPCDTPLLPADIFWRLRAAMDDAPVAVAETMDGLHPLCGVWRTGALPSLEQALAAGKHPPVRNVLDGLGARRAYFNDPRPFANINTPDDLTRAAARF